MASRDPLLIGPFGGGLNLFDDPTSIADNECVEALNWDPGLDGSLKSRPAFLDLDDPLPLGASGNPQFLGTYYADNGAYYLLASDGLSSTYYYLNGVWTLITSTFAASAFAQFDGKAWLVSPLADTDPGGYWTPAGGFIPDADMPHGDIIQAFTARLWIGRGKNATLGTRIYYSKVQGQPNFWQAAAFIDIGAGDGQSVVAFAMYYNALVIFRTRSVYTLQYATDPAAATVAVLVPGVGLENKYCIVSDENYLYFFYDGNAYQFINNQVQQINVKVPFEAIVTAGIPQPYYVSVFNKRVIFSYYDTMYVYSLYTHTWTRWRTPTFGPIGKFLAPVSPSTVNSAYALPSGVIPTGGIIRRNRLTNPSFEVNITGWNANTGASSLTRDTTVPGTPHVGRWTSSVTGLSQLQFPALAVVPGEHLSFRTRLRSNSAGPYNGRIAINFLDSGGVGIGSTTYVQGPGVTNTAWTVIEAIDVEVPAGAATARFYPGITDAVNAHIFYADNSVMEDAFTYDGTYFDGSTADVPGIDYGWSAAVGNSESTATTPRLTPLLYIEEDTFVNEEFFDCVLRTKNFSYELPAHYKRLFWWGVEAIFQGTVTGEAIPVVQTQAITWGQLLAEGKTWGDLLGGTWGGMLTKSSIETVYDGRIMGPNRKFVKFRKSLRFRQIGYEVTFATDAKTPLNLFTIAAFVAAKETVVKAIS